jgi:hypothetical protein
MSHITKPAPETKEKHAPKGIAKNNSLYRQSEIGITMVSHIPEMIHCFNTSDITIKLPIIANEPPASHKYDDG